MCRTKRVDKPGATGVSRLVWPFLLIALAMGNLFAGVWTAGATINPVTLPPTTCPTNLGSCTANDVTTTVKAINIRNGDSCTSTSDTIDLRITTAYTSTSNQKYDLGLFISGNGGAVNNGSSCFGAAAQVGQGNNNAYLDADTDLFLSLDPSG